MLVFKAIVVICFTSSPSEPTVCAKFSDNKGHQIYGEAGYYETESLCKIRTGEMEIDLRGLFDQEIWSIVDLEQVCKEKELQTIEHM